MSTQWNDEEDAAMGFIADVKKRINQRKAREVGHIAKDLDVLKRHWYWLKNLESDLRKGGIPTWLQ